MTPQPTKGYYSLIQYCPDLGRLEVANIGVLLFCPDRQFLRARMAKHNTRIIHFFGSEGHDWQQINAFKKGFEKRLTLESTRIHTLPELQTFIDQRANLLQITTPRFIKVTDPATQLDDLFAEFIGVARRSASAKSLQKRLAAQFAGPLLAKKLRHDLAVEVPDVGRSLEVPFGYQNGRFNLIKPVGFEATDPETSVNKACKLAVEGRSLFTHTHPQFGELQLVIVGQFRSDDQESPRRIRHLFDEYDVKLFSMANVDQLVGEILRTGKDIADPVET